MENYIYSTPVQWIPNSIMIIYQYDKLQVSNSHCYIAKQWPVRPTTVIKVVIDLLIILLNKVNARVRKTAICLKEIIIVIP